MSTSMEIKPQVSRGWRWATFGLAGVLLLSCAVLAYAVVDGAVSLGYCRAEQGHLKHDIRVLVDAARGRLSSDAFVAARAELDPALPQRLAEDNTLLLESVLLRFGPDALLRGAVVTAP